MYICTLHIYTVSFGCLSLIHVDVLYQDRPTTPYHMPRTATVVSISR